MSRSAVRLRHGPFAIARSRGPEHLHLVRRGVSLVEVAIASVLLFAVGANVMDLLSVSARGTARAGEHQLANVIAGRVLDRLLATGYAELAAHAGRDYAADLLDIGEPHTDGISYAARYRVDALEPGLARVAVTLTWPGEGRVQLVRLLADAEAAR